MVFPNPLIFLYVETTTFFAKDFRKTADIPSQVLPEAPGMFSGKQVSPFINSVRERTCGQARPWPV